MADELPDFCKPNIIGQTCPACGAPLIRDWLHKRKYRHVDFECGSSAWYHERWEEGYGDGPLECVRISERKDVNWSSGCMGVLNSWREQK